MRGCLLGQEAVPHPLADIVPGEPSRERRRVVRADERHVAVGWRCREITAVLAAPVLELRQVHPPDAVTRERLVDFRRNVAEVLAHHFAVVVVRLERENREQLLGGIGHVRSFVQPHPVRDPVKARPRHDVVDAEDAREARLMRDRRREVPMTLTP